MQRENPLLILLKKEIKKLLKKGVLQGVFPSAAAGVIYGSGKGKEEVIVHYGHATLYPEKRKILKNNYFDLASLTKPLATTLAVLCLIKEKKIDIDEKLSTGETDPGHYPVYSHGDHGDRKSVV